MSRRSILKVVKVNYTPAAPWMVRVPSRLQRVEGARKKFFEKESVAKAYVERLAKQLGDYHSQALGLDDRQKMEAAECFRLLGKHDASLLDAVHHYIAYLKQAKQSVSVTQLFEDFLAVKRQDALSPKYIADLRSKLGRFVATYSDTLVCNLTTPELETWIRSLDVGPVSMSCSLPTSAPLKSWVCSTPRLPPWNGTFLPAHNRRCARSFTRASPKSSYSTS